MPGRAFGCTSITTVAAVLPSGTVTLLILIGFGNDSGTRFTAPLNSGHSRSHATVSSTFLPASTSSVSTAGVRANGASPRIATTSSRVGRLEFRSVLFQTRVYGRTSRVSGSSPRLPVATSVTGPTHPGASLSAHSTTTPRLSLIVVGVRCSLFGNSSGAMVTGRVNPSLLWITTWRYPAPPRRTVVPPGPGFWWWITAG